MRLSPTLSVYMGRVFITSFGGVFVMFLMLIFLFDVVELLRRTASRPNVDFGEVVELALLKLPHMGQEMIPFAVLFGAMVAFWLLSRHHELVVARAAGVSAWQFLLPVIALAIMIGIFQVAALNPLASTMLSRYERLETLLFKGRKSLLALSSSGLWLRQSNDVGQSVLNASHVLQRGRDVELTGVTIFVYQGIDEFLERISADSARLEDGFWHLRNAWLFRLETPAQFAADHWLATDLTLSKIQDSFAPPETMSFWDLPAFIATLQKAGFSAVRHRLHFHRLLAAPLLMSAMILIAATFALRTGWRLGRATFVITGGVLAGFLLHIFSGLVFALGLSDRIPVTLAAWTPSGVASLLGLAMLLHLEDG